MSSITQSTPTKNVREVRNLEDNVSMTGAYDENETPCWIHNCRKVKIPENETNNARLLRENRNKDSNHSMPKHPDPTAFNYLNKAMSDQTNVTVHTTASGNNELYLLKNFDKFYQKKIDLFILFTQILINQL